MKLINLIGNERNKQKVYEIINEYKYDFIFNKLKKDNILNKEIESFVSQTRGSDKLLNLRDLFQHIYLKDNPYDFYNAFIVALLKFKDFDYDWFRKITMPVGKCDQSYLYAFRYLPLIYPDFYIKLNNELFERYPKEMLDHKLISKNTDISYYLDKELKEFDFLKKIEPMAEYFKPLFQEVLEVKEKLPDLDLYP